MAQRGFPDVQVLGEFLLGRSGVMADLDEQEAVGVRHAEGRQYLLLGDPVEEEDGLVKEIEFRFGEVHAEAPWEFVLQTVYI